MFEPLRYSEALYWADRFRFGIDTRDLGRTSSNGPGIRPTWEAKPLEVHGDRPENLEFATPVLDDSDNE